MIDYFHFVIVIAGSSNKHYMYIEVYVSDKFHG